MTLSISPLYAMVGQPKSERKHLEKERFCHGMLRCHIVFNSDHSMGVPSRVNTSMSLVQDGPTHKLIFMYLGAEGI